MENNITDPFEQSTQQIKKYLKKILSFWYLFVISVIITTSYALIKNRYVKPYYSSNTILLNKSEGSNPEQFTGGLQLFARGSNIENEFGVLKTLQMARKTLRQLNFEISYFQKKSFSWDPELYKKSPFVIQLDTNHHQLRNRKIFIRFINDETYRYEIDKEDITGEAKVNEWCITDKTKFKLTSRNNKKQFNTDENYYFIIHNFESLVKEYANSLKVDLRTKGSSILWLWMLGHVPDKMNDYLNTLSDIYIQTGLQEKNEIAISTIEFIDELIADISDSLNIAETNLQSFEQLNTSKLSNRGNEIYQKLQELETEKKTLQIQENYYNYIIKKFNENKEIKTFIHPGVMGVSDPVLTSYLQTLSDLYTEKHILNFTVKENADIQPVEILDYKTNSLKDKTINYVNATLKIIDEQKKEFNREEEKLQELVYELPVAERKRMNFTRKFNLNNDIYNFLLKRRTEAAITKASNKPDIKVLDKASMGTIQYKIPVGKFSLSKALVIGIIIPLIIVLIIEFSRTKISDISEVENNKYAALLGAINTNNTKELIPVLNFPTSAITESFRAIRAKIGFVSADNHKTIAITSTIGGEGKSFLAVNLAAIIAMDSKKVLLIGLDLRKPTLHNFFKMNNNSGISTYLSGNEIIESIIINTEIKNLDIILSGPIPPNPAELLGLEKMEQLISGLQKKYDYIIVDTAPVGIVSDALIVSKYIHSFLYIIRQNYSHKNSLKIVGELKSNPNIKQLNLILNDAKFGKTTSKYGYGYEYGNEYYSDSRKLRWHEKIRFKSNK